MPPAASDDVYQLLADEANRIKADPGYRVELVWTATGTVILVVYSEKGGVGKTALTTGLAAVAASFGLRVWVIDMDPRHTSSDELGIINPEFTVNDILRIPDMEDPADIRGAAREYMTAPSPDWPDNIRALAGDRNLGNREMDTVEGMTDRLAASLRGDALKDVDLVVIDVPPRPGGKLVATAAKIDGAMGLIPSPLDTDGWIGATDALTTLRRARQGAGLAPMPIVGVVRHIVSRSQTDLARQYDVRFRMEEPVASLLLRDTAVPQYAVRKESRHLCVPITVASSREARAIINSYTRVLNHVAAMAGAQNG
jgi:chromosome partitioning protein